MSAAEHTIHLIAVTPKTPETDLAAYTARIDEATRILSRDAAVVVIPPLKAEHRAAALAVIPDILTAIDGLLLRTLAMRPEGTTEKTQAMVVSRHLRQARNLLNGKETEHG